LEKERFGSSLRRLAKLSVQIMAKIAKALEIAKNNHKVVLIWKTKHL